MSFVVENKRNKIHPHKFALWAAMVSIAMMFGGLTSAYLVKQAAGNWLEFTVPHLFYASTVVILLSSLALHKSFAGLKAGEEKQYKGMLVLAFILGLGFVILQYYGWMALFAKGVDFTGNVSGSFFYLLTGVHVLHVLGGITVLMISLVKAFSGKFKVTSLKINRFDLVVTFWHFLDFLWLYLFIFLLISK